MAQRTPVSHRTHLHNATALQPFGRARGRLGSVIGAALMLSLTASPVASPLHAQSQDAGVVISPAPAGEPKEASPRLDIAPNGTPIVKIAKPNTNGTSYNRYQTFNVDERGLILNNSGDIVLTQLGGYIDGNGNLKNGSASLIINEVAGSYRSYLNGFIEIAGPAAELVIANPNGISCNGCGFINTPRVSIAAAKPILESGALSGFSVTNGSLEVGGQGLNASGARLDLFARAITLNAGVWADSINVAAGAGTSASGDDMIVVRARSEAVADAPAFALDVAALGGMYARSIRLIGTEDGLGVNVDGRLAAFDSGLSLSADGNIQIAGTVTSEAAADITSGGAVDVSGQLYADEALSVQARTLGGSGLIASGSDVTVKAAAVDTDAIIAAGLARNGSLSGTGNLNLESDGTLALGNRVLANGSAVIKGSDITVGGSIEAGKLTVRGDTVTLDANGALRSGAALDVAAGSISNAGLLQGRGVTLASDALDNSNGTIDAAALAIATGGLANAAGLIQSRGALDITAGSVRNTDGEILALGSDALNLTASGAVNSAGGVIGGNGDVTVNAGAASVSGDAGRIVASGNLTLDTDGDTSVTSGAVLGAGGNGDIDVGGALLVDGATVQANALALDAGSVTLDKGAIGAGTLVADIGSLTNNEGSITLTGQSVSQIAVRGAFSSTGSITSNGADLLVNAASVTNSGDITHAGSGTLTISSAAGLTNRGNIVTNGVLTTRAENLANNGALTAVKGLDVNILGALTGRGDMLTAGALNVAADSIAVSGGAFESGKALALKAGNIDLGGARVLAAGDEAIAITSADQLTAAAAAIGGNGNVTLDADTIDLGGSSVTALGTLSIQARGGDLALGEGGLAAAAGNITLDAAGTVDGSLATIESGALLSLSGSRLLLDDALLQADRFAFNAPDISLRRAQLRQTGGSDFALSSTGTLNYSGGEIYAGSVNFSLTAGRLINRGGAILHGGDGALSITSGEVDNTGGRIATNGNLTLTASSLDNTRGDISAAAAAMLDVTAAVTNDSGLIASGEGLQLTAGTLSNTNGNIETQGALTASLASLSGAGGQIIAAGDNAALDMTVSGAVQGSGLIGATGDVTIRAGTINAGADGRLTATGTLNVSATNGDLALAGGVADAEQLALSAANGTISTGTNGLILAGDLLRLTADTIDLSGGAAQGARAVLRSADFVNSGGILQSFGGLNADITGALDNSDGTIFSAGNADISAGTLTNNSGSLAMGGTGTLTLTIDGDLSNTGGTVFSNGMLAVDAGALRNDGGTISAVRGADLQAAGLLSNIGGGIIQSDATLTIAAATVANTGGTIDSLDTLDIGAAALANGTGAIIARGGDGLKLHGNAQPLSLTNGTGTIASAAALDIDAVSLANAGSVYGTDVTVKAGTLENSGLLYGDTLTLNGGTLVNAGGEIGSGSALSATFTTLDNSNGQIISGDAGLAISANTLRNNAGTLGGSGNVRITGTAINNGSGTIATDGDYTINAATLDNAAGGAIWAEGNGTITLSDTLTNRGSIAAADTLNITTDTLDNGTGADAGILAANNALNIDFVTGSLGEMLSNGDITLGLSGDYVNSAGDSLYAAGTIGVTTDGNFTNAGALEGAAGVNVSAVDITNTDTGTITAPVLALIADNAVINDGLINGGLVSISGQSVTNNAKIFGDSVNITGLTFVNNTGAPAIIAARGGLVDVRSDGTITNSDGAFIYSLGGINIGGAGGASAAVLVNSSATIQAQGDIAIDAASVTNNRAAFITEEAVISTVPVSVETRINKRNRTLLDYTDTTTETAITEDSGAAVIVGNNITIRSDMLLNDISTISANATLFVDSGAVTNSAFTGYRTVTSDGALLTQRRSCPIFGLFCKDWKTRSSTPYFREDAQELFTIPSTITSGGTLAIVAQTIDNLVINTAGVVATDFAAGAASVQAADISGRTSLADVTNPDTQSADGTLTKRPLKGVTPLTVDAESIGVSGSDIALLAAADFGIALAPVAGQTPGAPAQQLIDLGGLFNYAAAGSNFLIETDPAFTNYGNFLSSDYFLGRLGYDPNRVQQRLGDALYEQQLITNQLIAQAGFSRFARYGDNEAQYRALMDAGIAYMQQFGLTLGIGLSAEQMATLTTDMVLLVEVEVDTPNGKVKVLAPRVYLTQVSQRDLTSGGAIMAGQDIFLRSADSLTNQGVIRASASSNIVGGDILNTGRLDLGARGTLAATNDLISRGGTITGGDLTLSAGRDLRLESADKTSSLATVWRTGADNFGVTIDTATTSRGNVVDAAGNLSILAGRDLSVTGSDVSAAGDLTLFGGENISVTSSVDSSNAISVGRSGKAMFESTETAETNRLSNITSGGDLNMATPGALTVQGGNIAAGDALAVQAGSVNVSGVIDTVTLDSKEVTKKSGILSSKKTTVVTSITDETAVASTLEGDTVQISSIGDTSIAGSNVVATGDLGITAGGDISITGIETTDTSDELVKVKKSGLSLSGTSLFVGVSKNKTDSQSSSTTYNGSLVGSAEGNVTIAADGAIDVIGSQVVSPGTTTLAGESINIANATNVDTNTTETSSSSIGVTATLNVPVLEGVKSIARTADSTLNGQSDRTKAVAAAATALGVKNTIDEAGQVLAGSKDISLTVTAGISKSRSESESVDETVVGSYVAGNDVILSASGAGDASTISVTGSDVVADNDLTLAAEGAITLQSAQENDSFTSRNSSSGFSIGANIGINGITPEASVNLGKGNSAQTSVTNVESILSAGGTARVTTPGQLTLEGAQIKANRVEADVGGLDIISQQDTGTFSSKQTNIGASVSLNGGQGAGVSANFGRDRQTGDYASVAEQSGINAGSGGYDITVRGDTKLVGGVISSEADAADNILRTETLTSSDIENSESYKASSIGLSASLSGIGAKPGETVTPTANENNEADVTGTDNTLSGLDTRLGKLSAGAPVALGARGSQDGTTRSAIAAGTIEITPGANGSVDAASLATANTISRNTDSANDGALVQEFDDAKRAEIEEGFAVTRELVVQTAEFFSNRAREEAEKRAEAEAAEAQAIALGATLDKDDKLAAPEGSPAREYIDIANAATAEADAINRRYGAGSATRIIATAITGSAGANVTGGLTNLVQGAAVNVLQSLTVSEVKRLADGLMARTENEDGTVTLTATEESELVRGLLQGVVACGGAAAGGSGDCGSAALGAAAGVAVNTLINSLSGDDSVTIDPLDPDANRLSLEEQQARSNLVATLVGAIAEGAGLDTPSAVTAAQIETQNNESVRITLPDGTVVTAFDDPNDPGIPISDLLASDTCTAGALQANGCGDDIVAAVLQTYGTQLTDSDGAVDRELLAELWTLSVYAGSVVDASLLVSTISENGEIDREKLASYLVEASEYRGTYGLGLAGIEVTIGVGEGTLGVAVETVEGLYELVTDPGQAVEAVYAIATDPELREAVIAALGQEYRERFADVLACYTIRARCRGAGDAAVRTLVDVIGVATGVGGAARFGTAATSKITRILGNKGVSVPPGRPPLPKDWTERTDGKVYDSDGYEMVLTGNGDTAAWMRAGDGRPYGTTPLPTGYTRNADGSYTGPGNGKSWNTGEVDGDGNIIMRRDGGGYFAVNQNGTQIPAKSPYISKTPVHHVCTNKNCVSTASGGPWTPRFQEIFDNAGLNINSEINKIAVPGHKGPHPAEYHKYVYDELRDATAGLQPKTPAYTNAVQSTLNTIKRQAVTPGHQVNSWLTGN